MEVQNLIQNGLSIREIAEAAIQTFSKSKCEYLKTTYKEDLEQHHYGLGRCIRTQFLWEHPENCHGKHPEEASKDVLKEAWNILNQDTIVKGAKYKN